MVQEGLSLCIINRDDRENLVRLVREARPWVDEIVIVDTGSTDGSAGAAKSAGADVVVERPGLLREDGIIKSFALARNESYKLATKPWQLWLDTDDTLSDWSLLPTLVRRASEARLQNQWGLSVNLWYDYAWSEDRSKCLVSLLRTRLTHKDDFWRWMKPVHERLVCGQGDEPVIVDETLRVIHLSQSSRNTSDRNLRILLHWEAEDGPKEDPDSLYFYLGAEYCTRQQYEVAFEYFNRAAGTANPLQVSCVLNAGRCLMFQGKLREQQAYLRPFYHAAPHIADFYWDAAYICTLVGDLPMAAHMMNASTKATTQIEGETTKFRDHVIERLKSVHKPLI